MKLVIRVFGLLLAVGFAWWAVQMVAAESGEVVIVTTTDSEGRPHETRLWIVDHAGVGWLRAGSDIAGWYQRLSAAPEVMVERGEQVGRYIAKPELWQRDTINGLMFEKYGWAEWYIALVFNRDRAIPIRLEDPED
jgi:hypothetical protein